MGALKTKKGILILKFQRAFFEPFLKIQD